MLCADTRYSKKLYSMQANTNAREGRVMIFNLVEAAQEFLSEIIPDSHDDKSVSIFTQITVYAMVIYSIYQHYPCVWFTARQKKIDCISYVFALVVFPVITVSLFLSEGSMLDCTSKHPVYRGSYAFK